MHSYRAALHPKGGTDLAAIRANSSRRSTTQWPPPFAGIDPVAAPLPLIIVVPWAAFREFRNHKKYQHRWIVEVSPGLNPTRQS